MQKNKLNPLAEYVLSYMLFSFIGLVSFIILTAIMTVFNLKNPVFDGLEYIAELLAVSLSSVITGLLSCKVKSKAIINGFSSGTFLSLMIIITISIISKLSFNIKELVLIALCILITTATAIIKCNFIKTKRRKK